MSALESEKISPEDLQNKFNELQANLDTAANSAMDVGKKVGIVAAVLLIILVFLIGRRRGDDPQVLRRRLTEEAS